MSLSRTEIDEYRRLKDSGVDVSDENTIAYNRGSETAIHITAKSLVGLVGLRNDYRVDSEVPIQYDGTEKACDVLLWGHDRRLSYAVELEHGLTQAVKDRKQEYYVDHTAIDDIQFVELNQLPAHIVDALGHVGTELGLQP